MILQLAENHFYNETGLKGLKPFLGVDITFEEFVKLAERHDMWVVTPENSELNTIYIAHPGAF